MKTNKIQISIIIFVLLTLVSSKGSRKITDTLSFGSFQNHVVKSVNAQEATPTSTEDKKDDIQAEIEKYEKKISQLQTQAKSLANELDRATSEIKLTQVRITNSQNEIEKKETQISKLAGDIEELKKRIKSLEESIDYQQKVLSQRKRAFYKADISHDTGTSMFMFLLEPLNLETNIKKATYSEVMQDRDREEIQNLSDTKTTYNARKDQFVDKKLEEEELKAQLEVQKATLVSQRQNLENKKLEKERLIQTTQNDEAKFQSLLAEAQKELNSIQGAATVLKGTTGTSVAKGAVIGYQGNTGRSSGEHLHFGVYKYDSFDDIDGWNWYNSNQVDPAKKLASKNVYWNTGCSASQNKSTGSGDWSWPMSSPTISQGYGHTCWSDVYYGGKDHPAYDMYGSYGTPILAVEKGKAYACRNCLGDGGNGVFIFHDGGYMTLYWHLR